MAEVDDRIAYLVDLFQSIDVKEKGIESIYDLILKKQSVEDIKEFVDETGISLKRVYKVIQILEKLGLIQVFNRPMTINIKDPIPSWQAIISEKVKEIRAEADRKIETCELTFKSFYEAYQLKEEDSSVPPVEFISINTRDYTPDFIATEIIADAKNLKIAKGDKIDTPFLENTLQILSDQANAKKWGFSTLEEFCIDWNTNLPQIHLKVLVTEEYIDEISRAIEKEETRQLRDQLENCLRFPSLEIRITKNVITNFILKDRKELLQYSTSPDNKLIGLFASRQKEICSIFTTKFEEDFANARNLEEFYIQKKNRPLDMFTRFIIALI